MNQKYDMVEDMYNVQDLQQDIIDKVKQIQEIEKIDIIKVPDDVEADVGLRITPKKSEDRYLILDKLNDIQWDIYEKIGYLPSIYWEFD